VTPVGRCWPELRLVAKVLGFLGVCPY